MANFIVSRWTKFTIEDSRGTVREIPVSCVGSVNFNHEYLAPFIEIINEIERRVFGEEL